jgi:hypothetical protein
LIERFCESASDLSMLKLLKKRVQVPCYLNNLENEPEGMDHSAVGPGDVEPEDSAMTVSTYSNEHLVSTQPNFNQQISYLRSRDSDYSHRHRYGVESQRLARAALGNIKVLQELPDLDLVSSESHLARVPSAAHLEFILHLCKCIEGLTQGIATHLSKTRRSGTPRCRSLPTPAPRLRQIQHRSP